MPFFNTNDTKIYYEVRGSGQPLVIINGLGSDVSEMRTVTDPLAIKKYRLLLFDNRGAGRSSMPDEPYSIEMMATDLAQLMDKLKLKDAYIVGISMGGRIALELCLNRPDLVKKMVLVSSASRAVRSWHTKIMFTILPRLSLFKGEYPQPYFAFTRQAEATLNYDCSDKLKKIKKPVLIMHATGDHVAPLYLAEELNNGIKGSVLRKYKGGHIFFLFKKRDQFLDDLIQFLP